MKAKAELVERTPNQDVWRVTVTKSNGQQHIYNCRTYPGSALVYIMGKNRHRIVGQHVNEACRQAIEEARGAML